jgi:hypothetical protein
MTLKYNIIDDRILSLQSVTNKGMKLRLPSHSDKVSVLTTDVKLPSGKEIFLFATVFKPALGSIQPPIP